MPHKKRKVRKRRGSRTHGYGRVGQHRGGGQRGGRGKAGFHKHKWTYTVKYDPQRFGKRGFQPPTKPATSTISVGELDEEVEKLLANKQATKTRKGIAVNLTQLGYDKLLGTGKVTHRLLLSVKSASQSAAEKVRAAGGQILPPTK